MQTAERKKEGFNLEKIDFWVNKPNKRKQRAVISFINAAC